VFFKQMDRVAGKAEQCVSVMASSRSLDMMMTTTPEAAEFATALEAIIRSLA
jgi:hypothetical protein